MVQDGVYGAFTKRLAETAGAMKVADGFEPGADMVITKEETFGPVAPLYRFKTDDEAIAMANEAPHPSLPRPRGRVREGSPPISTAATSAHLAVHWGSKYGIVDFLEVKYLCMGGIDR
jgi:succinate-semialdehyde dehydrogenase/glutarate-semialdehyde dehydrogenase